MEYEFFDEYFSLMCQTGDAEKVKEALDSANVDEANDRGSTPLMHATWYGHIEVIKHLINAGANYTDFPAVIDRNIITTAHYKDMGPWMKAVIEKLNS